MELWELLVPAVLLAGAWIGFRAWSDRSEDRWWPLAGVLAWVAYWYWESQVIEPQDNIRVDLLLFWPLLFVVTVGAVASLIAIRRQRQIPPPPPVGGG